MNRKYEVRDILKIVKDKDIKFIKLCFVDILGQLKAVSISTRELEHALKEGMGLDGSSVEGFARIYESDLILLPDPDTFAQLPSAVEGEQSAVMFGDIMTPEGGKIIENVIEMAKNAKGAGAAKGAKK